MKLTWLGRSCFQLITAHQTHILFDPCLEYYLRQHPAPFPLPDIICVSHGHLDHFGDVPELVRKDSPALVVAIPRLCHALREMIPETQYRLFPIPWDDHVEVQGVLFYAFRSPPMQTSLYEMFQEFGVKKVQDFLLAFHELADEILYLPLTSFGVVVDGVRVLHFVAEGEGKGDPVDVGAIGRQFAPDVALVGVNAGEEKRSAAYAAALGAPTVIPHHHNAYGELPAADLDLFIRELAHLAPATT
ncbi:MAG: MBL fold metallo-hydrolase, partial [Anaerolineae bacterium]|nr:MBL fold metallo-hydrolase [Anaerolineae bacterium]